MLTTEENVELTEVGPGTEMGQFFRSYWLPVLPSVELPERDARPLRVRLLGEDLVVFRSSDGTVGLLGELCMHRRASLYFGRNEESGLRCVYHGWKYDLSGACVDMPNEPENSQFKEHIQIPAYPCVERGGVIWTYMGELAEGAELPGLPEYEWMDLPQEQTFMSIKVSNSNWLQTLEGDIDSSHGSFLHNAVSVDLEDLNKAAGVRGPGLLYQHRDKHPSYEVKRTDYGLVAGARRNVDEDQAYWRIYQILMPSCVMIPPYRRDPIFSQIFVPIDAKSTVVWSITWHPTDPVPADALLDSALHGGLLAIDDMDYSPPTGAAWGRWHTRATSENDYFLDDELQKTRFSGIPRLPWQDQAMQEGMGAVVDRTAEHLGTADLAILQARRLWLAQAQALRDNGTTPLGVDTPAAYRVRSTSIVAKKTENWLEVAAERLIADPGVYLGALD